jgi:hypothetical protein
MASRGKWSYNFTYFSLGIRLEMSDQIHAMAAFIPASIAYEDVKTLLCPSGRDEEEENC